MTSSISPKYLRQLQELKNSSSHDKYWNISWQLGEKLHSLILEKNPQRVLEVGTSNGFSTLWIALAMKNNSTIDTLDIHEGRLNEAKGNIDYFNIKPSISFHLGDVFGILEREDFEPFDCVFLDAAHKKYWQIVELLLEKNLITKDSMIIADNVISHSYMGSFCDSMKEKFNCEILSLDSGFLIARGQK